MIFFYSFFLFGVLLYYPTSRHNVDRQNLDKQNVDKHNVVQIKCQTDKKSIDKMPTRTDKISIFFLSWFFYDFFFFELSWKFIENWGVFEYKNNHNSKNKNRKIDFSFVSVQHIPHHSCKFEHFWIFFNNHGFWPVKPATDTVFLPYRFFLSSLLRIYGSEKLKIIYLSH